MGKWFKITILVLFSLIPTLGKSQNGEMPGLTLEGIFRGIIGIVFLLVLAFVFSRNKSKIPWKLVFTGLALQILFGVLVLKVEFVKDFYNLLSLFFVKILDFTHEGASFLFGNLVDESQRNTFGYIFAFQVLPTIIFFSALTSGLFYLGILQKVVFGIAWVMSRTMRLSGAESLSTAANIFLGQTEAPLMVKPYISTMTYSEIMCIMTGGTATIAGGVLAAYVGFLGGSDPASQQEFATHLLTASIMNAPAAIIFSKILIPEMEPERINTHLNVSKEKIGVNLIDAISNGTMDGLKMAVGVGSMLIAFIAIIALVNYGLKDMIGASIGINGSISSLTGGQFDGLTLQFVLGQIFRPIAFLIGINWQDSAQIGNLLGQKTILNEFIAYGALAEIPPGVIGVKSKIIATYALCGFANFSSIGIQIAGIGGLAPNQRPNLSRLGLYSLLGGTLSCLLSATIAGALY
jgi:CNT family concentrative nucleoside transporter